MIRIESSDQMAVNPEMAREWLNENDFSRQRNLRPQHRDNLVREILEGRFIQGTQVHFAQYRGGKILVNGQHTLSAIEKSGRPVTLSVLVSTTESMDEVAELYSRHDNHLSRSLMDAIKARDLHNRIGLTLRQAGKVAGAIRFIRNDFGRLKGNIPRQDVLVEIEGWEEEGNAFFETIAGAPNMDVSLFSKASVLSLGLTTLRHQEEKARKFWRQVAFDDGTKRGDPRKTLREFLLLTREKRGPVIRGENVVTPAYIARSVATAWNAFFSNKALTRIHVYDPDREILIKGTPHKGPKANWRGEQDK